MVYSKKIVEDITRLIASDSYTIVEICKAVGIAETTFYDWKLKKPEFLKAVKKAEAARMAYFVVEAKKSLLKKIQGYSVDETKTVFVNDNKGKPIIKEKTVTSKYYQPDTISIIFTLTNGDPANWKNRQREDTPKPNDTEAESLYNFDDIPEEKLNELVEAMMRARSKRAQKEAAPDLDEQA